MVKFEFTWARYHIWSDKWYYLFCICRSWDGRWSMNGNLQPWFGKDVDDTHPNITLKKYWMPYFQLMTGTWHD